MFLLKNIDITVGEGLLFSLVAIVIVFVVLFIIIFCVYLLSKFNFGKKEKKATQGVTNSQTKKLTIDDIEDDDMMVAALIATAEFVEETKQKDARLVNIKRIA